MKPQRQLMYDKHFIVRPLPSFKTKLCGASMPRLVAKAPLVAMPMSWTFCLKFIVVSSISATRTCPSFEVASASSETRNLTCTNAACATYTNAQTYTQPHISHYIQMQSRNPLHTFNKRGSDSKISLGSSQCPFRMMSDATTPNNWSAQTTHDIY